MFQIFVKTVYVTYCTSCFQGIQLWKKCFLPPPHTYQKSMGNPTPTPSIVCTLPPALPLSDEGGVEPPTNFSKREGGLTGSQFLVGSCWERLGDFFHGGGWGAVFT